MVILGAVTALLIVAAVALAPPSQASNFGPSAGNVWYTDTAYQIHIYRWLGSTMTNSADYVRGNETAQTVMRHVTTTSFSNSEVAHYDAAYGEDFAIADTGCFVGEIDGNECNRHRIRYNTDRVFNYDTDHVACHEMGHAVALGHRSTNDGCMAKNWRSWSGHSRAHVDSYYG